MPRAEVDRHYTVSRLTERGAFSLHFGLVVYGGLRSYRQASSMSLDARGLALCAARSSTPRHTAPGSVTGTVWSRRPSSAMRSFATMSTLCGPQDKLWIDHKRGRLGLIGMSGCGPHRRSPPKRTASSLGLSPSAYHVRVAE